MTPPKTYHTSESATVQRAREWVSAHHPSHCVAEFAKVSSLDMREFGTLRAVFAAHVVAEHGGGLQVLDTVTQDSYGDFEENVGLREAVSSQAERLVDELIAAYKDAQAPKPGGNCVLLVARNLPYSSFERLWRAVWSDKQLRTRTDLAGGVFKAGAFSQEANPLVAKLAQSDPLDTFALVGYELPFCLLVSPHLVSERDNLMPILIKKGGTNLARYVVAQCDHHASFPPFMPQALHAVIAAAVDDALLLRAKLLLLRFEPDVAIPLVLPIVNSISAGGGLPWELKSELSHVALGVQERLFAALADDAIQRDEGDQQLLADRHSRCLPSAKCTFVWFTAHETGAEGSVYKGALLRSLASETFRGADGDVADILLAAATALHARHGHRDQAEVFAEFSLTDSTLPNLSLFKAAALARDVYLGGPPISVDEVLAAIRRFPATFKALGGSKLEREMKRGKRLVCARMYTREPEDLIQKVTEARASGQTNHATLDRIERRMKDVIRLRDIWETRFAKLEAAGVAISDRKLREQSPTWGEARLAAHLVDGFEVHYEPKNLKGFAPKEPDFLLMSADGNLALEVASIGQKPEDALEGVGFIDQTIPKKTLQNKLRGQLKECREDFGMPVAVAIETAKPWELDHTLEGSLYGPIQFSFATSGPGIDLVSEGTKRDQEMAFFEGPSKDCISAVIGFAPEGSYAPLVDGTIFDPPKAPKYPLSPALRLRLRTALFGPRPSQLIAEMSRVPTISQTEAESLVDHGVDNISFLAAGLFELPPNCGLTRTRFEELQAEARRLGQLLWTGDIGFLKAAQGVDLGPLRSKGIRTIRQLLDVAAAPPGFDAQVFSRLQEEAAALS